MIILALLLFLFMYVIPLCLDLMQVEAAVKRDIWLALVIGAQIVFEILHDHVLGF